MALARVALSHVDPTKVDAATHFAANVLMPAAKQAPGLLHWYAGFAPDGSAVSVTIWETHQQAEGGLDAVVPGIRSQSDAAGITPAFTIYEVQYEYSAADAVTA